MVIEVKEGVKLKHTNTRLTPIDMEDKAWMFEEGWDFSKDTARLDVTSGWIEDKPKSYPYRILDVGCASGKTLKHLRNLYPKASLIGVEPDENLANMSRKYATYVVDEPVEDFLKIQYLDPDIPLKEYFDYILFSDVIEHLKDPWIVLRDIRKFLKEGGTVIASIPNIGFITIVVQILKGRFYYGEGGGIINKEHLRFFTLKEMVEMFGECGYKEISFAVNTFNINEEYRKIIDFLEKSFGKSEWQNYEAYQYVVRGEK